MRRTLAVLAALVLLCAPGAVRAELIIDTFQTPDPADVFIGPAAPVNVTHSGAGILGTRTLTTSTSLLAGDAVIIGTPGGGPSALGPGSLQSFAGSSTFTTSLSYLFPAAQDFTGFIGLQLTFDLLDSGPAVTFTSVDFTLFSGPGGTGPTLTASQDFSDVFGSTTSFSVPFSAFAGAGNLANVTGLRIDFNNSSTPRPGVDFILTEVIAQIPEPASLAVWGLVGVTGMWYARRRAKAALARAS